MTAASMKQSLQVTPTAHQTDRVEHKSKYLLEFINTKPLINISNCRRYKECE